MPSITTWTRIEPLPRNGKMSNSLQARIHDPLWLLARQWQLGELQGEDAGSITKAEIEGEISEISHYLPGKLSNISTDRIQEYSGSSMPLEVLVEKEPTRQANRKNYTMSVESGQYFFLLLGSALSHYRSIFLNSDLTVDRAPETGSQNDVNIDDRTRRFLSIVGGRALDGEKLYALLSQTRGPNSEHLAELPAGPPFDSVAQEHREAMIKVANSWLVWYEAQYDSLSEGTNPAWISEKMAYEFSVSAPTSSSPTGEAVLTASDYPGGHLDWYSFDIDLKNSLGAAGEKTSPLDASPIPTPVYFPGMPNARWWEFEDSRIDFGALKLQPDNLAGLLLINFMLIYGNDFFVIPIKMKVGSICRTYSLRVTNTFGETTKINPTSKNVRQDEVWRVFTLSSADRNANSNKMPEYFFLPPVIGPSLEGEALEDVLFMRDEVANVTWAVEQVVESHVGAPINRSEIYHRERQQIERSKEATSSVGTPTNESTSSSLPSYHLASSVPDYWIPFLPVKRQGSGRLGLQRYAMLRTDNTQTPILPRGVILEPQTNLILNNEEVPRTGIQVTRSYQYSRWIDGSLHTWIGRRKQIGKGEGSSGLQFDIVKSKD